jgi:tRNA (Thr-GGU) A37 N-methylase
MADNLKGLRIWRNGEVFNARDYVYERNLLLQSVQELTTKVDVVEAQKVILSDETPVVDMKEGDIWIDIV